MVPNSIPLLGKAIDEDSMVFKTLKEKLHSTVTVWLDDDAMDDAYRMYKFLNKTFRDKVRVIESPAGYDASDYHREFGRKGIVQLLRTAHKLDEFTLMMTGNKKTWHFDF